MMILDIANKRFYNTQNVRCDFHCYYSHFKILLFFNIYRTNIDVKDEFVIKKTKQDFSCFLSNAQSPEDYSNRANSSLPWASA